MSKPKLYTGIAVALALVVIIYSFYGAFINPQKSAMPQNQKQNQNGSTTQQAGSIPTPPPNSVLVQDVVVGTGAVAEKGAEVSVEYIGKLQDGTVFDQSSSHGGSFKFSLGAGQVIPGWDQGIVGMKIGGERILIIPPALAYGNQQVGAVIPPNSTLVFDVRLVGISTPVQAQ